MRALLRQGDGEPREVKVKSKKVEVKKADTRHRQRQEKPKIPKDERRLPAKKPARL